ncbi:MAG TPA: GAF domain-containing sensor histidine kinase [Candidatus Dormibacteraeota bacterium]
MANRRLHVAALLPATVALAVFLVDHTIRGELLSDWTDVALDVLYYVVGAVTFMYVPYNRAARRLLLLTSLGSIGLAIAYITLTTHAGGWGIVLVLQTFSWTVPCTTLSMFAVFPDGLYQRIYERGIVVGAVGLALVLQIAQVAGSDVLATHQFVPGDFSAPNPFFVPQLRSLGPLAAGALNAFALSSLVALVLLIIRYRRFGPQQRRQIRWPLFGIAIDVVTLGLIFFLPTNGPASFVDGLIFVGIYALFVVAPAIGILNPRWLDVDVVIRRSLVYGLLWLLIAAAYVSIATAVGVALGQRVPLELAILLTIAATLFFQPARQWLERLGDRLVFGRRLGGYQLISQLGAGLESSTAANDVAGTVAAVLQSGLGARWVRVDLNRPEPITVAVAGVEPGESATPTLTAPLVNANQVVGRIDCGPKTQGDYAPADQELLTTLGRQAALSIRNSQLTAELSDRLEELAASRMRLVQADDAARRRLERDLHDGVQQQLVGLLARLGLARNQLRRDPELAGTTLREAHLDTQRALETVQELARGIHPAVLTDRGLVDAVRERATRMTVPVDVRTDGLVPGSRFATDLEGAAYFFVSEALANVLKHADAKRVEVRFSGDQARLVVEVEDDGRGFDLGHTKRSGIRGLQDRVETLGGRLELTSKPGKGTVVRIDLPQGERAGA